MSMPYAIRIEKVFYFKHRKQINVTGLNWIIDLRDMKFVELEDYDEGNPDWEEGKLDLRRWRIIFKNGEFIIFYPIHEPREGPFLNNSMEIDTTRVQRYKAFRYLFTRLSEYEQNLVLNNQELQDEMNHPLFFESELD